MPLLLLRPLTSHAAYKQAQPEAPHSTDRHKVMEPANPRTTSSCSLRAHSWQHFVLWPTAFCTEAC